jgi:hypothetical protein
MWGRVTYRDGFNRKRFTDFCHRYKLYAAKGGISISVEHARFHEHGNHTDEG